MVHLPDVGRHRGLVSGWGRHRLPLSLLQPGRSGWLVGPGRELLVLRGCIASRPCRGAFRHEGGCGGVYAGGGASCRALLLPGSWRQELEVEDDVRWGLDLRCRLGAGLGFGLGFGGELGLWCGGWFDLLLVGGLGWWLSFGLRRCGGFGLLLGCRCGL